MSPCFFEIWLSLFSLWGCFSIFLVSRFMKGSSKIAPLLPPRSLESDQTISIFKPTPPFSSSDSLEAVVHPLESFLSQMTDRHELLLGVLKHDLPVWQKRLIDWRQRFPLAVINVVHESGPSDSPPYPNPKINWNHTLSKQATGTLWLWSDLDVTVPPQYLNHLLKEWSASPKGYLTNAYLLPQGNQTWGIWDSLFVHFEFLPGVLLLDRLQRFRTAFGAGILFPSHSLTQPSQWDRLGSALADDFQLAQSIGPGRLSKQLVQCSSPVLSFPAAFSHYLRWHKTIRWCDPKGYAGLILILPLFGTLLASLWNSDSLHLLGAVWLIESLLGGIVLMTTVNSLSPRHILPLIFWPWLRLFAWIWSWLPISETWGGTRWSSPDFVRE